MAVIARAGWDLDLRYGEAREDAFGHMMLEARSGRIRIEHKSDEKAKLTGNVFIEFRQNGRPSGIAVTTAEFWAIEYDYECWIVLPTTVLKKIAARCWKNPGNRKLGGDFGRFEGVLVPLTELLKV